MLRRRSFLALPVLLVVVMVAGLGCGERVTDDTPFIPDEPVVVNGEQVEAEHEPAESPDDPAEADDEGADAEDDAAPVAGPPADGEVSPSPDDDAPTFGARVLSGIRTVLAFLGKVIFVLVLLIGIAAALLGMPGTVLVLVAAVVFSLFHGWEVPPWWVLLLLLALAVLGETAEHVLSFAGVKRSGATNATGVWTMVGGLTGAVLGGIIAPILAGIGALAGPVGWIILSIIPPIGLGMVGGFYGGYLFEVRRGKSPEEARTAGWGALFGRLAGSFTKALIVAVMVAIVLISTWGALFS